MSAGGQHGGRVRAKAKTRSLQGALHFYIGGVYRLIQKGDYADRVVAGTPRYLTAAILELAENAAHGRRLILSRAT